MQVLIVEDEKGIRAAIARMLRRLGDVEPKEAGSFVGALRALSGGPIDLILLDLNLSDRGGERGGLELLRHMRATGSMAPAIVVSSSERPDDLREALRLGVRDYIFKNELDEKLIPAIERVRSLTVRRRTGVDALTGSSPAMVHLRRLIQRVADADATVLVLGETGTGKELVARALHQASVRAAEPYRAINCAAFPEGLLESLLFGHEKGVYTGASEKRQGHFETVGAGTLLLDEIAEMSTSLQAKLLRALEERQFLPLGADKEVPLRARIVASTHVDLEKRIAEGMFRSDLYFRLKVVIVSLPPLRDRTEDMAELVDALTPPERALRFTPAAIQWLARRPWPGNVRELRNDLERVALLADDDLVDVPVLDQLVAHAGPPPASDAIVRRLVEEVLNLPYDLGSKVDLIENELTRQALDASDGNHSAAGRLLGVPRKTIARMRERLVKAEDRRA